MKFKGGSLLVCSICHRVDSGSVGASMWYCRHVRIDCNIKHKDWPIISLRKYLDRHGE